MVKRQAVGLDEVIGGALAVWRPRATPSGSTSPRRSRVVDADPVLLERAIANIVDNALQLRAPGTPVRVEAGAIAGRVDLRVIDTGRASRGRPRGGVPPFQRLGDSPNGTGVGLGLAVARGFVVAMGGDLTAEDTPGGGTTMVLSLPEAASVTRAPGHRRRGAIRQGAGDQPPAHGYEVDVANTERTARTRRQPPSRRGRARPRSPGIDGIDVLRAARLDKVPVIVLSARHLEASKVDALDEGADDYVTKPFGMDELLAAAPRPAATRRTSRRRRRHRDGRLHHRPRGQAPLAAGEPVHLTPKEWQFVELLVRNPGKLVSPAAGAPGGVGPPVRPRDGLPPRVIVAVRKKARAGAQPAALLHHRTGHGLPVRARRGLTVRTPSGLPEALRRSTGRWATTPGTLGDMHDSSLPRRPP